MKPLNLFLFFLVLTCCISACKKEAAEPLFGDFGLRKGECMVTSRYLNSVNKTEYIYNAEKNCIVESNVTNGTNDSYTTYTLNDDNTVSKTEIFNNGILNYLTEYFYNTDGLLANQINTNFNLETTNNYSFQYNLNQCSLTNLSLNGEVKYTYSFFDDNCSYEELEVTGAESKFIVTHDDGYSPYKAITPNKGYKLGNYINSEGFNVATNQYTFANEIRNIVYNQYNYPLSYEVYRGNFPDDPNMSLHQTYSFQYYCFE